LITSADRLNAPLIRNKLSAPQPRAGLVARPQLLHQLIENSARPFLLVCAPAGYGKTTLLVNWIAHLRQRSAPDQPLIGWLSLDEADNEPIRFMRYLVASIESAVSGISTEAHTLLHSSSPSDTQTLLTILINDLENLATSFYLVVDDYQFISNPAIHAATAFILSHLPSNFHLVIATRSDPPIPLARLRARGQMAEIRASDLRFSLAEAECLFNQMLGLNLAPEDTQRLEERTEGWIAGLQMAALVLRSMPQASHSDISTFVKGFSGSNRYILDYLVEEVLGYQSQEIQDFLLRTSILKNLCGPLCDAVLGVPSPNLEGPVHDSRQMLEYLEHSNLFLISLDAERQWYRYHHLFANLLQSRLRQSLEAAQIQELSRRAGHWYESNGMVAEAIDQALSSSDLSYAVEVLEKEILTVFYQGEFTQVHHWLGSLPEPLIIQHALLCAVYAAAIALLPPYPIRSLQLAEKWMQAAEQALLHTPQNDDYIRAFISNIRSYWAHYRAEPPEVVLQIITQALSFLPADSSQSMDRNWLLIRSGLQTNLGLTYWDAGNEPSARQAFIEARQIGRMCGDLLNESASIYHLILMSYLQGRLGEAISLCREALASFESRKTYLEHRSPHSTGIAVQLAEILIEQNHLEEVERILEENIQLVKWTTGHDTLIKANLALARLAEACAQPAAAFEYLNKAEKVSEVGAGLAAAYRASLWLRLSAEQPEYLNLARQWGNNITLVEFTETTPRMEWIISLVFAHLILIELGAKFINKVTTSRPELAELLAWLERQERTMQARAWVDWVIPLRLIECRARWLNADKPGSLAALRSALELAAPEGYVRVFVDEGQPLRKILTEFEQDAGWLSAYLIKLQAAFPAVSAGTIPPTRSHQDLVETLTARETEILRAMAEGLSNSQIAEKFVLAEGTVKFYVHAILEKLGVHNRTQAVVEAKKLAII
jgi:LuxR family transcriptional regulator, maltose regulon positive regulatory protein